MNIKIKNRALSPIPPFSWIPALVTFRLCAGMTSLLCPPLAGVQGVVALLPGGTVSNRSYRLYKLAEKLDIVGTVPRCRDCSPNSPKRKAARSGTAPYSLINPPERLETVPYNLIAHLLFGALGDRALQPHRSRLSFHSLLIARC